MEQFRANNGGKTKGVELLKGVSGSPGEARRSALLHREQSAIVTRALNFAEAI